MSLVLWIGITVQGYGLHLATLGLAALGMKVYSENIPIWN